jgi:hypothetical protein
MAAAAIITVNRRTLVSVPRLGTLLCVLLRSLGAEDGALIVRPSGALAREMRARSMIAKLFRAYSVNYLPGNNGFRDHASDVL